MRNNLHGNPAGIKRYEFDGASWKESQIFQQRKYFKIGEFKMASENQVLVISAVDQTKSLRLHLLNRAESGTKYMQQDPRPFSTELCDTYPSYGHQYRYLLK